ncbi:MAG: hypothetical protein J3K34DRAFT_432415 [Monoraphidium minutum]|nr:MAG: hypothetical protein J3K34DRAFT_432415 [Monoraphidium minutum]
MRGRRGAAGGGAASVAALAAWAVVWNSARCCSRGSSHGKARAAVLTVCASVREGSPAPSCWRSSHQFPFRVEFCSCLRQPLRRRTPGQTQVRHGCVRPHEV